MHLCLFLESLVPGVSSLKIVGSRRKQQFWDEIDNGAFCHYLLLLPNIAHKFVKIRHKNKYVNERMDLMLYIKNKYFS